MKSVIRSEQDLATFLSSQTFVTLWSFLEDLNKACLDHPLVYETSFPQLALIANLLEKTLKPAIRSQFPPEREKQQNGKSQQTLSRFGDPAFRAWLTWSQARIQQELLPVNSNQKIPTDSIIFKDPIISKDAAAYLSNSFGNWQRIDYGTGHELHFLAFMYCLFSDYCSQYGDQRAFDSAFLRDLGLFLFPVYLHLMRQVQATYWLEPAGSHGVWGLDDYHFLPFLFGSAQLAHHPHLRPKSIHNKELRQELAREFLYMDAVEAILSAKSVNLPQSLSGNPTNSSLSSSSLLRLFSPMLDDISGVKEGWNKINQGLMKMYRGEVLSKLPIMQHFLFGHVLNSPLMSKEDASGVESDFMPHEPDHVHIAGAMMQGDCCGNPIPSRYSTSALPSGSQANSGTRYFPID